MKRVQLVFASAVVLIGLAQAVGAAEVAGTWVRPNGEIAQVSQKGGHLYCKIVTGKSPGFEMCNGMEKSADSMWQGGHMKHPEMPGFMTFNGTVTLSAASLTIKGCAIGQSMCDAETWTRKK
jgi:uncharacterized protein (DUF2147 family)